MSEFTITDIPYSITIGDFDATTSDDLSCIVCGAGLTYGGRGPKPKYCDDHKKSGARKSTGTRTSSSQNVESAIIGLSTAYDLLTFSLFLVSPLASSMLANDVEKVQEKNRQFLEADPKLAKSVANATSKGSSLAFIFANVAVVAPPCLVAASEMSKRVRGRKSRRQSRPQAAPKPGPENVANPFDDSPIDLDDILRRSA